MKTARVGCHSGGFTFVPLACPKLGRQGLFRLKVYEVDRHDFVRLAAAAVDVEGEVAGDSAVNGAGRIEHEGPRPGDDASLRVVIRARHDIDLLAELGGPADNLPCLARRGRVS